MTAVKEHREPAEEFVNPSAIHVFFAIYISMVWLTPDIKAPFGDFEGIPAYVVLTPIILLIQGRRAIIASILIATILFSYEFCKNFQGDYHETAKGIIGIIALSALLPTIYYAVVPVLRCPPKFIGNWLTSMLLLELAAIVISIPLGFVGIAHSLHRHYLLPIMSYSGFFREPSHVAMALSPFLFMMVFDYRTYRRFLGRGAVWGLASIVFLCTSATEFATIGLAVLALIGKQASRGRLINVLVAGGLMLIAGTAVLSVKQISMRVLGVLVPKNAILLSNDNALSILAFFKGFEMAKYGLFHMPLGVAFLDMASLAPHVQISHVSFLMKRLNSSDGSSNLFKGISEFGYLYLIFAVFSVIRMVIHIGRYNRADANALQSLLALALQFTLLTMFIRGGSYFEGNTAISIAMLIFPSPKSILSRRKLEHQFRLQPLPHGQA